MGGEAKETKWIELIRVRASAPVLEEAMPGLKALVDEVQAAAPGGETFFMQHALYDGDLAVVVVWKDGPAPQKSVMGQVLAARLQELGPVDHAVWIPAMEECET